MTSRSWPNRRSRWILPAVSLITAVCLILLLPDGIKPARAQPAGPAADGRDAWTDLPQPSLQLGGADDDALPARFRSLALDLPVLEAVLANAPPAGPGAVAAAKSPIVLALPLPQGGFGRFAVENSPVLAPALAAAHPQIQTYQGRGLDDPRATVRLGLTPQGFHALILADQDSVYITRAGAAYLSYFAADYTAQAPFVCGVDDDAHAVEPGGALAAADAELRAELGSLQVAFAAGSDLRTFRLAVSATGEYTADAVKRAGLLNPTNQEQVAAALAALVTQINMVNAIYAREVSIRFELVPNNTAVIYLDPATDPFTNDRLDRMLAENRSTLDSLIGSANYDLGHALGTAGGGVAFVGVACNNIYKGGGVSGTGAAATPYTAMVIAHELGHQLGANHTFNARSGGCGGGNRSAGSAYEPGSGSTIMSYSGLCPDQDLPGYFTMFHVVSFDQIYDYTRNRTGSLCSVATPTGNQPPAVDAGPDYTIPARTPFVLTGTAQDPDGDPLSYSWQQVDLPAGTYTGTATLQQALVDWGTGPLFRVYPFSAGGQSRSFPAREHVLADTVALGEVYPTTDRSLNFRLFTRDDRPTGGGANYDSVRVSVIDTGAAFHIMEPSSDANWPAGLLRNVQWDVGGTHVAPIACAQVDLLYSSDGGATFPVVLSAATANDGSSFVTTPSPPTAAARILVRCAGNVFYAISPRFTIRSLAGSGVLRGKVHTSANVPLAGARVHVAGADTLAVNTDAAGEYSLQLPMGTYTLTVTAFGYARFVEGGIQVADGSTTTRTVTLTSLPQRTISGTVTDAGHGYPLYASLNFTSNIAPVWTDPLTGVFSATLVEGETYTVTVIPWLPGYAPLITDWPLTAVASSFDIALQPDLAACRAPGYQPTAGGCVLVAGGLLAGSTYDAHGAPLAGVTIAGAGQAVSSTVTADPRTPDSFYSLFLPAGVQTVTAAAPGLPAISITAPMTSGAVVGQDFNWQRVYADASLQSLALQGATLAPLFGPHVQHYSATVSYDVTNAALAFSLSQPGAAVHFNGVDLPPNTTTASAPLQVGVNVLVLEVTALNGQTQRTYTITITRAPAPRRLYLPALRK